MLMAVPKTLTAALNTHRTRIVALGVQQTSTNVREVSYAERYRESTGIRETPTARLQRIADADTGFATAAT
jgi:hypothetical protein